MKRETSSWQECGTRSFGAQRETEDLRLPEAVSRLPPCHLGQLSRETESDEEREVRKEKERVKERGTMRVGVEKGVPKRREEAEEEGRTRQIAR